MLPFIQVIAPGERLKAGKGRSIGASMVGAIATIVITGLLLSMLATMTMRSMETSKDEMAGEHALRVLAGAVEYINANKAALLTATAGGPVAIPFADLQAGNFILPGLQNVNGYNQTYNLLVYQPAPNRLEGHLTTTGGEAIPNGRLGRIARKIGAAGGFVDTITPATIQGVNGGWSTPVATYAATGLAPTPGHIVLYTAFAGTSVVSNWLSRIDTGDPLDRTMQADILMGGNNIANARLVTTQDVVSSVNNFRLSTSSQNGQLYSAGSIITKPACPTGQAPKIQYAPAIFSDNATGNVMSATQSWSDDLGSSWRINLRVRTASGWTTPNPAFGQVEVFVSCTVP